MKLWPIHCRCGAVSATAEEWAALAPLERYAFIGRLLRCQACPPFEGPPW